MIKGRIVKGSMLALLGAAFFGLHGAHAETAESPGQAAYGTFCASCHGIYGRGDGPLSKSFELPIPDFTVYPAFDERSDDEVFTALREAPRERHSSMAIALVLDKEAFVEAIRYARALSAPGGGVSLLSGRDIYNSSCWMCHGPEGNGKGLLLRDIGAEARNFSSQEFVIDVPALSQMLSPDAENAFHGSRYMPGWTRRLTPHQLQDLVEFLKTFQSGS